AHGRVRRAQGGRRAERRHRDGFSKAAMIEPASEVIAARAGGQGTLMPTLAWSVAGHLAIIAAIWLAPGRSSTEVPPLVMTINIGGAPGPRNGGLTEMGGRAVPDPPKPPEPKPA